MLSWVALDDVQADLGGAHPSQARTMMVSEPLPIVIVLLFCFRMQRVVKTMS